MLATDRANIVNTCILPLLTLSAECVSTVRDHREKSVYGQEDNFKCWVIRPREQAPLPVPANLRRLLWQEEQIIFVTLRDNTAGKQLEETLEITA
jgi:hypothetical protein